jgi:hypothetical protein
LDPRDISEVTQNDPERCYYCKKLVFGALRGLADKLSLNVVMDGTNASDLDAHRPGLKALRELGIVSPLLDFTKEEVRNFARNLGLTNADAPSAACLLTSFPYGTIITPGRVERLRDAERAVKALGIAKVKIRDHNDFARIEIDKVTSCTPRLSLRSSSGLDLPTLHWIFSGSDRGAWILCSTRRVLECETYVARPTKNWRGGLLETPKRRSSQHLSSSLPRPPLVPPIVPQHSYGDADYL